jgi:hypothetical protein
MMNEPVEVRLARIEEGMVNVHSKMDRNHIEVMSALGPVQGHGEDITILKRDRHWAIAIITFIGSVLGFHMHGH